MGVTLTDKPPSSAALPTPPEKDPSLSNREFHPAWYFTPNPTSHQTPSSGSHFQGCLPVCVLSDATTGPLPVCDPASTDSRSGGEGSGQPLLSLLDSWHPCPPPRAWRSSWTLSEVSSFAGQVLVEVGHMTWALEGCMGVQRSASWRDVALGA